MDEKYYNDLKRFFKQHGITQQQIADIMGVKHSYVNALLNGGRNVTKAVAQKWHDTYGLSMAWLLTGEGEMMAGASSSGTGAVAVNGNNNTTTSNVSANADLIASLIETNRQLMETNRQLSEQNAKLVSRLLDGSVLP